MNIDVFPTKDTLLSKAKSSQKSRSETVLANRSKYGKLKPLYPEEVQHISDYLLAKFDECPYHITPKYDISGEYTYHTVVPSEELYGGNHRQSYVSYREDNIPVGQDSEYVNWNSGYGDSYSYCFHTTNPGLPCPLDQQESLIQVSVQRMNESQRLSARRPHNIILPLFGRMPVAEYTTAETGPADSDIVRTIEWVAHLDWLRDIIWYEATVNGERHSVCFLTDAWLRTTDAQLMRMLRNETARLTANEDVQNRNG